MVSETGVDADPAAILAGLNEAVAPAGRPETLRLISAGVELPPEGVTARLKLAEPPAEADAELEAPDAVAMVKSTIVTLTVELVTESKRESPE
jgi:hypothetical protein